jgi:hypothetical protein
VWEHPFVTSDGSPHGRFQRALARGNVLAALAAARELHGLTLADALALCVVLAEHDPPRFDRAAVRRHGRFEIEATGMGLAESQLALAALGALTGGDREAATNVLAQLCRLHAAGLGQEGRYEAPRVAETPSNAPRVSAWASWKLAFRA